MYNILFIFSDEHSHRFLGCQNKNSEPAITPNLDKLASQGTFFEEAYCQMPLCSPSRICTFSGQNAENCGAWTNESVMRPELPNLARTLTNYGYETCLVGKYHLGGNTQFGGFNHRPYGDLTGKCGHQWEPIFGNKTGMRERTSKTGITQIPESLMQEKIVFEESLAFLREHRNTNPNKPWFLCASVSRPHFPLTAPKRFFDMYEDKVTRPMVERDIDAYMHPSNVGMREGFLADCIDDDEMMKARHAYFACVSYLDEMIGDFLVRMDNDNLLENTIIIYSTDHGELAGENGVFWKHNYFEGCTKIPLIVSMPEQRNGTLQNNHIKEPVGLIDLFPTLCELNDIEIPKEIDGSSFADAFSNKASLDSERMVFTDNLTPRWGEMTEFRMARYKKYKYVAFRSGEDLMYDLENDPFEKTNLLNSPLSNELEEIKNHIYESIFKNFSFEDAEYKRTQRDKNLHKQYPLDLNGLQNINNLYIFPDGRVVCADDTIYMPRELSKNYKDIFTT